MIDFGCNGNNVFVWILVTFDLDQPVLIVNPRKSRNILSLKQ